MKTSLQVIKCDECELVQEEGKATFFTVVGKIWLTVPLEDWQRKSKPDSVVVIGELEKELHYCRSCFWKKLNNIEVEEERRAR